VYSKQFDKLFHHGVTHTAQTHSHLGIGMRKKTGQRKGEFRERLVSDFFVKFQMCWYHVTFHLDLKLEHTLDVGFSGDHRVQVWSRDPAICPREKNDFDFRDSTKVPISRDL